MRESRQPPSFKQEQKSRDERRACSGTAFFGGRQGRRGRLDRLGRQDRLGSHGRVQLEQLQLTSEAWLS